MFLGGGGALFAILSGYCQLFILLLKNTVSDDSKHSKMRTQSQIKLRVGQSQIDMIKDFNSTRSPGLQAALFSLKAFLMVTLLAVVWEFAVEDNFFAVLSQKSTSESVDEHLNYVITVAVFAFIALIAPTFTLCKYICDRDVAEDQARHLATHDSLTNLPNRNLLYDRLDQAIAHAHRHQDMLAVMFVDLDGFKAINDKLGHTAGDFVLANTAARLTKTLRETDTIARFGGDEFVVIIGDVVNISQLQILIQKIKMEISVPTEFEGHPISVGASIGYALYPEHTTETEELIRKADKAMYKDKTAPASPLVTAV